MSWGKSSGAASAGDLRAIHRQEQTGSRCYPQTHPRLFTPACTYNCVGFRGQESAFTFQKEANFEILGTVNGPTPPNKPKVLGLVSEVCHHLRFLEAQPLSLKLLCKPLFSHQVITEIILQT